MCEVLKPENMRREQKIAANALVKNSNHAVLGIPGSGKTTTILHAVSVILSDHDRNDWVKRHRVLLIAPRPILDSVWQQEAERWERTKHLRFDHAHRLSGDARAELWFEGDGDITTCTPDTLVKFADLVSERGTIPVDHLVVDEAHLFVNPKSKRGAALLWLNACTEAIR